MDSMRSLNTSLPQSPRTSRSKQPPEELIQAFKAAALSVTNLYKKAAVDQGQARQVGYQDALDELLSFLDKENLGLDDGEGWRVRQWATERLDGSPPPHAGSDSEDDRGETTKRARSSSPVIQRTARPETEQPRQSSRSTSPRRTSAPIIPPTSTQQQSNSEVFSFRSIHPYPQDVDMQPSDTANNNEPSSEAPVQAHVALPSPAVRVEVLPRGTRTPHRGGQIRHTARSSTSSRTVGAGAGSKRRVAFGDYFDIGSLGDGKDGQGGGGKRSRFT